MIGILLHKRGHRVLDGSEPKVKTKRIECISEAAFFIIFCICVSKRFSYYHTTGVYEFFTTFTKKNAPLKNNLTFLGMENDLAAKNNGGY